MDATAGYVYILINPSLNGVVKIGKTQNSPDERAKELSSATGVPTPFFVAYSSYFKDCAAAEKYIHSQLAHTRTNSGREFFRISVREAIEFVRVAEELLGTTLPIPQSSLFRENPKEIFQLANKYRYGENYEEYFEKSLALYEEAAEAGFTLAYWKTGRMYLEGEGCKANKAKAVKTFMRGVELGVDLCWTELANIQFSDKIFERWEYCWNRYFESRTFRENILFEGTVEFDAMKSRREYQMFDYVQHSFYNGWKTNFMPIIAPHKSEISQYIIQNAEGVCLGEMPITAILILASAMDREHVKEALPYCQKILSKIPDTW